MLQKKPRIQPMSWSLTALLLAACGGGGGGGGSATFTRPGAQPDVAGQQPPLENVIFTRGANSFYSGAIGENAVTFTAQQVISTTNAEQVRTLNPRIDNVEFLNPQKAIVTISVNTNAGRTSLPIEYFIGGEDAESIELVSFESDGKTILKFQRSPDYERPLDTNGDNLFKISITARYGSEVYTERYDLRVTDKVDGPTTVTAVASPSGQGTIPAHTREGDEIRITVEDGNREIFVVNVGTLNLFGQNLLAGPDADKFQFKTIGFGSSRKAVIEFKDASSTDAPTDVGDDNIYNFELDGAAEDIYGDISFVVEVV